MAEQQSTEFKKPEDEAVPMETSDDEIDNEVKLKKVAKESHAEMSAEECASVDNLEGFRKMCQLKTIQDTRAFTTFMEWSGPFLKKRTTTTLSFTCLRPLDGINTKSNMVVMLERIEKQRKLMESKRKERQSSVEETDEKLNSDSEGSDDDDDDFTFSSDVLNEPSYCTSQYKLNVNTFEAFYSTDGEDICYKCRKLSPPPEVDSTDALGSFVSRMAIEPFVYKIDSLDSFKLGWVNKHWAVKILQICQSTLIVSLFEDTLCVAVQVFDDEGTPFTYVPFGFLISTDLSKENIVEFLNRLKKECTLEKVKYIVTSNNHKFLQDCCRSVFGAFKTIQNLFELLEFFQKEFPMTKNNVGTFETAKLKHFIVNYTREREIDEERDIDEDFFSTIEYPSHLNMMKLIKHTKNYVRSVKEAGIEDYEGFLLKINEEVVRHTMFIAKQELSTKIQYLDYMSEIRGNNVVFSLPESMILASTDGKKYEPSIFS